MTAHCSSIIDHRMLVFEENKSRMELSNKQQRQLEKTIVDGCRITTGIRCDWLVKDIQTNSEIYIELKGTDIEHAYEQIKRTVTVINSGKGIKKTGVIVCVRCPINSNQIQILTARLRKSMNVNLVVKSSIYKEGIEKFI